MKILLVEDDEKTADFVLKGLKQAEYEAVHAPDGLDALEKALAGNFDLAIVDIMLPKMDGLSLVTKLRENGKTLPVLILSAKNSVDDKVLGLSSGCDDYLGKPFAFSELLARIQALLRRSTAGSAATVLTFKDLTLDLIRHKVTRGNEKIDIQPLEFALLEYLVRNAGTIVSKTMIMEHVWEYNFDPQTNIVETRVCRLRDKIDKPFPEKLIHTVRGFGYVVK